MMRCREGEGPHKRCWEAVLPHALPAHHQTTLHSPNAPSLFPLHPAASEVQSPPASSVLRSCPFPPTHPRTINCSKAMSRAGNNPCPERAGIPLLGNLEAGALCCGCLPSLRVQPLATAWSNSPFIHDHSFPHPAKHFHLALGQAESLPSGNFWYGLEVSPPTGKKFSPDRPAAGSQPVPSSKSEVCGNKQTQKVSRREDWKC